MSFGLSSTCDSRTRFEPGTCVESTHAFPSFVLTYPENEDGPPETKLRGISRRSEKSLNSLESLDNGRILLYFPQSGGPSKSLESLNSLESLENGLL